MEIKCSRCGETKPAEEFCWKRKDRNRRDSYCRPCRQAYGRSYYRTNRDKRVAQDAARKVTIRVERTRLLLAHFAAHPCVDCGETDPVVLEFDHLRDKKFTIGSKLTHMARSKVLAEIEKCEVVCANCHRRRTFGRKGTVRLALLDTEAGDGDRTRSFSLEG